MQWDDFVDKQLCSYHEDSPNEIAEVIEFFKQSDTLYMFKGASFGTSKYDVVDDKTMRCQDHQEVTCVLDGTNLHFPLLRYKVRELTDAEKSAEANKPKSWEDFVGKYCVSYG